MEVIMDEFYPTPPVEGCIGMEYKGIYDGILFWFDPKEKKAYRRFDEDWYNHRFRNRKDSIQELMAQAEATGLC
jgi:hypothetical protein